MSNHRFLVCFAALLMVSCGGVRQVTKLATVAVLNEMDATRAEADRVREIGLAVHDFASQDGTPDTAALRLLLVEAVDAAFGPDRRLYVLLLVDEIVVAIVSALGDADSLPDEVRVVISDAGLGVQGGATFYIAAKFP